MGIVREMIRIHDYGIAGRVAVFIMGLILVMKASDASDRGERTSAPRAWIGDSDHRV